MRKLLSLAVILVLASCAAFGAVVFDPNNGAHGACHSTASTLYNFSATVSGELYLVGVRTDGTATVSDSHTNTYSGGSADAHGYRWYTMTAPGAYGGFGNPVSVIDGGGATFCDSVLICLTGHDSVSPFVQTVAGSGTGNTVTIGSQATTTGNGWVVFGTGVTQTMDKGVAWGYGAGYNSAFNPLVYQQVASASSITVDGSFSGSTVWTASAIEIKCSGCGGVIVTPPHTLTTLGVGVAEMDPDTLVPLVGAASALAVSFPPSGKLDKAVKGTVDALMRNNLAKPDATDDVSYSASKSFALNYTHLAGRFDMLGFQSPLVDWSRRIIAMDTSNGAVNWDKVKADFSDVADFGLLEGWFIPNKTSADQLKSFLFDFAKVIDSYNRAN